MENWKEIEGFEGYYAISDKGRVMSCDRKIVEKNTGSVVTRKSTILKNITTQGYSRVSLSRNDKKYAKMVHRLVAIAFIPNPYNKREVNHIDGDKNNNHVSNLEWVTPKENTKHAWDTGLCKPSFGESHGCSKFKNEDILLIRSCNYSTPVLANMYKVNKSTINRIKKRVSWKHI